MTEIYENDLFINSNIPFLFNKEIIEYDMKEAGFNLTKEYKLLDKSVIDKLEKYRKEKRTIELGKIQRGDSIYRNSLKEAFKIARGYFFQENGLETSDIISIKKDAIFTTKFCSKEKIGDNIHFRPKHTYSSYIHLGKNLEFYYSPNELSVKGLNDKNYLLHKDFTLDFISKFFYKMETESPVTVIEYTKKFIDKYKFLELPVGYYRTFDFRSCYLTKENTEIFYDYWEEHKDELDISYNYFNILLKLIKIPL